MKNIVVSICCIAYNHEKYIQECLDGFLMQKTNFDFEIIIHDDASTDKTADIIRESEKKYPEIIKPIYQTQNQYSTIGGAALIQKYIYPRTTGRYIAWCEGDDYWTDPLKLQKQVNFLESNPEYGLVYTKAQVFDEEKQIIKLDTIGLQYESFDSILKKNPVITLTVLMQNNLLKKYVKEIQPKQFNWKMGDYPIWIWMAYNSNIKFIDEISAVYRYREGSISRPKDYNRQKEYQRSTLDIRLYFKKIYKSKIPEEYFYNQYYRKMFHFSLMFRRNEEAKAYFIKIKDKKIRDYATVVLAIYRRYFK